jgi:RNA polymerase sigma-70 factor (ECF subfamily)
MSSASAARTPRPERLPDHLDRLYRAARALCGSPHDAEDLVQETCVRVLARPRLLRGGEELPYLLRVLRNTYLTSLRSAGRRPRTVAHPVDETEVLWSPSAEPETAVAQRELLDAVAALPYDFRCALVAIDIVGLSYREAARALGTNQGPLTSRLFRARRRAAHALRDEQQPAAGEGPRSQLALAAWNGDGTAES